MLTSAKLRGSWYWKEYFLKLHVCMYLLFKFKVSSIISTSTSKWTPKRPTQIRFKDNKLQHYLEKISFKYSSYVLWEVETSLFLKGLNFKISTKRMNHADYFVNFKVFYRDIDILSVLFSEHLDFIKEKSKNISLSSFRTCVAISRIRRIWCSEKSHINCIVIQKSGKGNFIVTVDRDKYIKKMVRQMIKISWKMKNSKL